MFSLFKRCFHLPAAPAFRWLFCIKNRRGLYQSAAMYLPRRLSQVSIQPPPSGKLEPAANGASSEAGKTGIFTIFSGCAPQLSRTVFPQR